MDSLLTLLRQILSVFSLLVLSLCPSLVIASVENGTAWLKANQGGNGTFYTPQTRSSTHLATLEALSTLIDLNTVEDANLLAAMEYALPSSTNNSSEHLAKFILIKHGLGADYSQELSALRARQGPNAGFGYDVGYESDPLSTALALEVFAKTNIQNLNVSHAVQYLLARQKADGSWSLENNLSNITVTAQVLKALWGYRNVYAISASLENAAEYLLDQRTADGLWPDLATSAHALIALLHHYNDRTVLTQSMNALAAAQLTDGSFDQDVYTTALAIYALQLSARPAPDEITLAGRLIDGESGNPLVGVTIEITGTANDSQLTDLAGSYMFGNLQPGNYTVKASAEGYSQLSLTTVLFKGSKRDLGVLKLTKLAVDPITGDPVTTGTVRGAVTDRRTGLPIGGVVISIPAQGLSATTDSTGHYQISNVSAGSISLTVVRSGYADVAATATLSAQQTLHFSPSLQEAVNPGFILTGAITDYETGIPLTGATVTLFREGNAIATTSSGADGRYEIGDLPAGSVSIEVSLDGYHAVSASAQPEGGTRLEFSPRLTAISQTPVITQGGITGVVLDAVTGRGIGSADIHITYDTGSTVQQLTGADGEFAITDLDVGDITIELSAPDYQPLQASLTIQSGLLLDLGGIRFYPVSAVTSGKLVGHVADVRTEQPISAVIVSLRNTTTNQLFETLTTTDGTFDFPVIPDGTYAITLNATGYEPISFTAVVALGEEVDLGRILMREPGLDALIPDVAILEIDRSTLSSDADTFKASGDLNVTIINRGNTRVEVPFEVYAFEDVNGNGTYDPEDTLLGQTTVNTNALEPLPVDGTLTTTIDIDGFLSFRDAPVSILLDATNVLIELSKANNLGSTAGLCGNQQKPSVDLTLCMDSSGSVSAADFRLQLEGTAQAIETVIPRDGSVRVSALQFNSSAWVELTPIIVEEDNARAVADSIRSIVKRGGGTSIHACIDSATALITSALPESAVQVIDVSTDGVSNQSSAVAASSRARAAGVDVLNAIGVGSGISTSLLNAIVFPQPVGGDRGFVLTVRGYQEYMDAISAKIQRETKIADLTLGGTRLIDHGAGINPDIQLVVGNASASVISEPVTITLYDGAPEDGGLAIVSKDIEAELAPGGHLTVSFNDIDVAALSSGRIVAEAQLSGSPECNTDNNRQEISVASQRGTIDVQLNGDKFAASVDVLISSVVTNTGALEGHYSVYLTIFDDAGFSVQSYEAGHLPEILPEQSTAIREQWNTGLTASGQYRAVAQLFDERGVLLDEDEAIFFITELDENGHNNGQPLGRVSPFTDRPEYHINSPVVVGYSIENTTQLHSIANPSVLLMVTSPSGAVVYSDTVSYASLIPGQLVQWQQQFALNGAEVGNYQVNATLTDDQGIIYGVGTSPFVVINDARLALHGSVTSEFSEIDAGNEQHCVFTAVNAGSDPIENQQVRYTVVDIDRQQVKSEESVSINLGVQDQLPYQKAFSTGGYTVGAYACVLEALHDRETTVLAASTFTVNESPIKMVGDIDLGEKSRLLALIDASEVERSYLEDLLDEAGWFYTIVDNAAAFSTELLHGGYGVYALLSEDIILSQATLDQLEENIAAGDGLVVAGSADRRHQSLENVLGIRVHARQSRIEGIFADASELGDAWIHPFEEPIHALTFDAAGANVIGRYIFSSVQGDQSQALGAASDFNVFVLEEFTSLSSSVEGRIAVGGDLSLQHFSVGDKLDASLLHDVVVVGGDAVFPSGRIYHGNLLAGGSVAGVSDAVRHGMAPGAEIVGNTTIPVDYFNAADYLKELSMDIAGLPANGSVEMKWGGLELAGDCSSQQQVFTVNADELATAHTLAVSCIPEGATVILNVPGQSATIRNIGMQSLSHARDRVLFNFPQAQTLSLKSVAVEGSILAPHALVDQPAGRVEGQIVVKSWLSTDWGYMSIHNHKFKGDLSAALVPKSDHALATYYQAGKAVFAGFDVLDQAMTYQSDANNVFAHLLLAALEYANPESEARSGRVVPVAVTATNVGGQAVSGQMLLALSDNLVVAQAEDFTVTPDSSSWVTPFDLPVGADTVHTLYIHLPESGSATLHFRLQTGDDPDWIILFEKPLILSVQ